MPKTPFIDRIQTLAGNSADSGRLARWADLPLPFNPHKRSKSPFTPNVHLPYEIMDVGGYDSLVPKRFIDYCTLFEDAFIDYRALIAFKAPSIINHQRFRDLDVKWILSQGELPAESQKDCTLIWDDRIDDPQKGSDQNDDFIQLWEINNPEPRAFLTRKVAFSNDESESPLVFDVNLAARGIHAVVLEDPSKTNRSFAFPDERKNEDPLPVQDGSVSFLLDEPERLILSVTAPQDCYLILRDGWFPEWKASLDGQPASIFPADSAFRAVFVPQGEHVVEFNYDPSSFHLGMWITIGTLLLIVFMLIFPRRDRFTVRADKP
jgi:hypothetical protein